MLLLQATRRAPRSLQTYAALRRGYKFQTPLLTELRERGLIAHVTQEAQLAKALEERTVLYAGIDPTAKALHVGHLIPLMTLLHFQLRGHRVLSVIGGATGLVGDPSGRDTERPAAVRERVAENVVHLKAGVARWFARAREYADPHLVPDKKKTHPEELLDNLDWWRDVSFLDFLRDVGAHGRMSAMLARDSVQSRLTSAGGMSFAEFSYQLLQAQDFAHLHAACGCTLQVGGSDQFGNIVAGLDLLHRRGAGPAFGLTTPLLTTAAGAKIGKSAGNALWLDPRQTGAYDFWQFWLRTADADVGRFLRMFTLLPLPDIAALEAEHAAAPDRRLAQRRLADEVTRLVHGDRGAHRADVVTRIFHAPDLAALKTEDVLDALATDPRLVRASRAEVLGTPLVRLATMHRLVDSGAAAKRILAAGGLYLNDRRVEGEKTRLEPEMLMDGRFVVLRAGKGNHIVLVLDN